MVMAIRKTLPMILMACMTLGAHAAELPTTLIVGFQAGGGLDSVARALANELNKTGKHKIVVENKPGASGMMAIDAVRNASRNSALLVIMPGGSITMTPHTNKHFQYDPQKDLVPVARLATYTLGVAVSPDVNAATLAQFLKLADNSQKLAAYGTAGIGLSPHFVGETIAKQSRVNLVHVPYKGAGPAINDALGKQIPAVISTVPSLLPMVRDGRLKLLATTGTHRDKHAPGVPTLKELGYQGWLLKSGLVFLLQLLCLPMQLKSGTPPLTTRSIQSHCTIPLPYKVFCRHPCRPATSGIWCYTITQCGVKPYQTLATHFQTERIPIKP